MSITNMFRKGSKAERFVTFNQWNTASREEIFDFLLFCVITLRMDTRIKVIYGEDFPTKDETWKLCKDVILLGKNQKESLEKLQEMFCSICQRKQDARTSAEQIKADSARKEYFKEISNFLDS